MQAANPAPASRRLWPLLLALSLAGCASVTAPGPRTPASAAAAALPPEPGPAAEDSGVASLATPAPPEVAKGVPDDLATAPTDPIGRIAARLGTLPVDDLLDENAGLGLDPAETDRSDLWDRVRRGYGIPDLDTALVRRWENHYAARPDYVRRMSERGGRYLFHIVEEIERRGMPTDLALLPFIESAFNPQALSRVRAAGMWQFMPATGKDFELRQNLFRDDRRDVLASTRAALDYLQMLHRQFGDWHLALAAYNWGQGNVQRAIRRNQAARAGTTYLDLRMPDETRNYVPKLQAIKNIIAEPERFGLALPPLENHAFFLSVPIERDIDVALAARLAGVTEAEFQALNPQMNKPVILAAGTPHVLLPHDNAQRFAQELAAHEGPMASWTAWVAPATMTPAEAARRVGMSEARLREVNRIPPRMQVRVGSALLVPRSPKDSRDVGEQLANHGTLALARERPAVRRVVVRAGPQGDSVAGVARRHGVTAAQVARWNKVGVNARFAPGTRIVVMLPAQDRAGTRETADATPARVAARPAPSTASRPGSRPAAEPARQASSRGSSPRAAAPGPGKSQAAQRHPSSGR
jgi:membrane-bound lytic murein transglycosylase D